MTRRVAKAAALALLCALGLLLGLGGTGPHARAAAAGGPLVPHKDNLYAVSYGGKGVTHLSIGSTGALHYEEFFATGDPGPWNAAMTPDGAHLYVANYGGSDVSVIDVQSDGSLAEHDPNFVDVGSKPYGIAVSPDGRNLYVANSVANTVSQFTVGADGSLTPLGDPVDAGRGPMGIAVSPDGTSVYVAVEHDHAVAMFDRSPVDGSLTAKDPVTVDAGAVSDPTALVLTPDGKYAYLGNYDSANIVGFSVGAGGVLDPLPQGSIDTGYGMNQLVVSPDGLSLYGASCCNSAPEVNDVWQYTIDPETGELTQKSPATVPLQYFPSNMWLSADGTSAYVSTGDFPPVHNQIEQFDVNPDGTLTPKAETSALADNQPSGVVIPPDQGPAAAFDAAPAPPGSATAFDATASSDADGTVAEYDWSFGDGTTAIDGGPTPTHAYASVGSYTVTLHVTDDAGCSTDTVSTGQTAYCAGNAGAEIRHTVVVGDGTTTATTTTTSTTTTTTTTTPTTTVSTSTTPTTTSSTPAAPPPASPPPPDTTPSPAPSPFGTLKLGQFAVAKSAVLKHAVWLNAASAIPSIDPSNIANVQWDFDNDGRFDWTCGGLLTAMSVAFQRPGEHTVALKVTTLAGDFGVTNQKILVTPAEVTNDLRPDATPVFDCENPGANQQPDRTDCVKSFSFGLVDVNSQGKRDDCFTIEGRLKKGVFDIVPGERVAPRRLSAATSNLFAYHATINGPVLVNGLYVPIPESATSEYDSGDHTVGLGTRQLRFGGFKTVSVPLNLKVEPDKFGAFHVGDIPLGKGISAIGGLQLDANVSIDLVYRQARITYQLKLPNIFSFPGAKNGPQGKLVIYVRNGGPFTIDGGKLGPTDVFIGPLLIKRLQFTYSARNDAWSGGAEVWLPGAPVGIDAAPPPPDKGFGLKHGQFDHAGIGVTFPDYAEPAVFPGLFLKHLDVAIGVDPLRFTGSAGFDAAKVAAIDGEVFVAFASPDEPYQIPEDAGDLQPLSGRTLDAFSVAIGGTVSVKVPVIDDHIALYNGYLLYEFPSLFEFAGGFNFDVSFLHIDGGVKAFLDGTSGKWSAEAGVKACLKHIEILGFDINICHTVGGVISSKGIAFCTSIPIPSPPFGIPVPIDVGAGYDWGGSVSPMVFDCDYGPWRETVPGASLFSLGVQAPQTVALPASLPAGMFRLKGLLGAPDATFTGPDGTTFSTASMPSSPDVEVLKVPGEATTYVALRHPAAGTWTVAPTGAVPLLAIETASGLQPATVTGRVSGSGARRSLRYTVAAAQGRTVTFVERGPHTYHVLGTATGAQGVLAFTPGSGPAGARQIVALVDEDGRPSRTLVVTTYPAPSPALPGRPARLRVARDGSTTVATWRRVAGAVRYATMVTSGGATQALVVTRRPVVRLGSLDPRRAAVVQVRAVGPDGRFGPPATRRVRARR